MMKLGLSIWLSSIQFNQLNLGKKTMYTSRQSEYHNVSKYTANNGTIQY